jgi:threonyl-tRNA synthetase
MKSLRVSVSGWPTRQLHPNTQLRAGSSLGDGFFYEFAFRPPLTLTELPLIEARMRALAATNHSIRRETASRATPTERLSLYRLGDFESFAAGPHVPTTKVLQAFTLDHISGMSQQRIYGTCWSSQQELDTWRAPPQVMVVNIDERQTAYAHSVTQALRRRELRANSDLRNEKISHKIRQHSQKVPYLLVVGEKEKAGGFVSLRSGSGEDFGEKGIEAVCELLNSR